MKTDFLEGLGLSKDVIDKVMAENGKDIAAEQAKTTSKDTELSTAKQTIIDLRQTVSQYDGKDPLKLEKDLQTLQGKYDTDIAKVKLDSALDVALLGAKARDAKAVKPFLNLELVKLDGDKVLGLEEQLKGIKESKGFLFEEEVAKQPVKTGMRQTGSEGAADKKDVANQAFRSLFGKE